MLIFILKGQIKVGYSSGESDLKSWNWTEISQVTSTEPVESQQHILFWRVKVKLLIF